MRSHRSGTIYLDEPDLHREGSFKAAEARFTEFEQVDPDALQRWLSKARDIQWDYRNLIRRKGRLERIGTQQGPSL